MSGCVQRHDVRTPASADLRLARNSEEGLASEIVEVALQQVLYFALQDLNAAPELAKRDESSALSYLEQGHTASVSPAPSGRP